MRKLPSMALMSEIRARILSASSSDPQRMSGNELAAYTRRLAENRQETDRSKIAFCNELIDPLAIFVRIALALALPFAYRHTRSGGVSLKIFIGIMIGVSFMLVNTLLGMLTTWNSNVGPVPPQSRQSLNLEKNLQILVPRCYVLHGL